MFHRKQSICILLFLLVDFVWTAEMILEIANYRLPQDIIPQHYSIEIITNLGDEKDQNFEFHGKVWIDIKCMKSTSKVVLHSLSLQIAKTEIKVTDTKTSDNFKVESVAYDQENELLTINLNKKMSSGSNYRVYIEFSGTLSDDLAGYYKSSYKDQATKDKKWMAVTQFEAIKARKAFPCFDEPAMKATFNISLGRKEMYSSVSNMPIQKTEPIANKPGWFWDHYGMSVPMSTYLVAFAVSDFTFKQSDTLNNNVTFRTWARKDAIDQVNYAKNIGPKILEYFEDFFDIEYPLPKQDMMAVPDFAAGAMENWGLITYRETTLLYDPKKSSFLSKFRVASVIAHELAHQWFGNLVTMQWWTDLWLNEGFATFMGALATHHIHPEWKSLTTTDIHNLLSVLSLDSLESSHPVSVPIGNPKEIDEIFDTISYNKGSSILRMMYHFLGEETLRKGVTRYLEEFKYKNAEQDDLWESLTKAAHEKNTLEKNLTVKIIMDSWTLQTGYPVITIKRLNDDKHSVELQQDRFLRNQIVLKSGEDGPCWWVPLSYSYADQMHFNNTHVKHWMSCPQKREVIENIAKGDSWYLFNTQMTGIYRINYDTTNWDNLIKVLNSEDYNKIPVENRVQLIDDAANLAWKGVLNYSVFFEIIKYLPKEDEYAPWHTAISNIDKINTFFERTSSFGDFRVFMKKLLTPAFKKLDGFKDVDTGVEELDRVKYQHLIRSWACYYEIDDCISDAKALFADYRSDPTKNPIPINYRGIVYCYGIAYGGTDDWMFLWNRFKQSNVASEKIIMLSNLGCTRVPWILTRFLEWSVNESYIRKQDSAFAYASVAANDIGYDLAKQFLQDHIQDVHRSVTPNPKKYSKYLSPIAQGVRTEKELEELKNFTQQQRQYLDGANKIVDQSLEAAKLNILWRKKHFEHVKDLLKQY